MERLHIQIIYSAAKIKPRKIPKSRNYMGHVVRGHCNLNVEISNLHGLTGFLLQASFSKPYGFHQNIIAGIKMHNHPNLRAVQQETLRQGGSPSLSSHPSAPWFPTHHLAYHSVGHPAPSPKLPTIHPSLIPNGHVWADTEAV